MYYLNVSSNIMSLAGWRWTFGVLVDAAIVMAESGYRRLSERPAQATERERVRSLIDAAKQVGPALFFSLSLDHCGFVPSLVPAGSAGRAHVPSTGMLASLQGMVPCSPLILADTQATSRRPRSQRTLSPKSPSTGFLPK
jgi:Cu/Ag efflux pump CusA